MHPLAPRMSRLGTETAFEVLARARALEAKGRDIVHLEIGEPDFDTPPAIVAAGVAALERGETHYAIRWRHRAARGCRDVPEGASWRAGRSRPGHRYPRRQADHVLRPARVARGGRRG